ncbi:MAG TPA: luciferase family protein [Gaiellaceae bacterium]|nr:luciferase family protein [Gaiellaceae bacterium]
MNAALLEELSGLDGVEIAPSQWTGMPALWVDGREIVHAHDDWIEIRLTRKLITKLDDDRAAQRARTSDWVLVDAGERELIVELARRAVEANRGAH